MLIEVSIKNQYASLVRERTHFYNASGFGMNVGLLGAKIKAASMSAILEGGIGFATPGTVAKRAAENSLFLLFEEPEEDWLTWSPPISREHSEDDEPVDVNQLEDENMRRRAKFLPESAIKPRSRITSEEE